MNSLSSWIKKEINLENSKSQEIYKQIADEEVKILQEQFSIILEQTSSIFELKTKFVLKDLKGEMDDLTKLLLSTLLS